METPKAANITSMHVEGSMFPRYEKPLRKAFYNGLALLLLSICTVFTWGSFVILEPFLKPLFWALLCGSVLHPLKYKISSNFKTWIVLVEQDFSLPIVFRIISYPFNFILDLSEQTGEFLMRQWMKISAVISLIPLSLLFYSYTPKIICYLLWKVSTYPIILLEVVLDIFESKILVATLFLGFATALALHWDNENENYFLNASYLMWLFFSAHASTYVNTFKLQIFLAMQIILFIGFLLSKKVEHNLESGGLSNTAMHTELPLDDVMSSKKGVLQDSSMSDNQVINNSQNISQQQDSFSLTSVFHEIGLYIGDNTGDIYIYWVSVACVVTIILQLGWVLLYSAAILPIVYAMRHFCVYFGIADFVYNYFVIFKIWLYNWCLIRKRILVPAPILYLNNIFTEVGAKFLVCLKDSSDSAASIMVILALVFFVIFGSTFLIIQAYTESVYIVKVGGSVINQTVVHNPELIQLLPERWEENLDSVLNNAYTYGRQALSKMVRSMLSGVSEEKTEELEKRALEVWDRVYQAWMMSTVEEKTIGPKVTSSAVYQTWDHFLDAMHKTPELFSMSALTQLAQNNMATLTSGLESMWELIRGNASLVLSAVFTVFSLVFSHGFALLNFLINMIVFLTALFYLLSSSRNLYKPVEVITAISPVFGSRLALAMENAVKEVLTASFRLALFYGLWTWLIHNLFQMNIVYIPSVLAAMLAVVPALGTYWACLPAVLDLWLAQGKKIHAITLAVCQFFPTLFVDATIYTEIKEGHPYLTGLAVAGGLFCMGVEGAIIGPLILCCLYVVVSMSSAVMQDATPTTPQPTTEKLH